MAPSPQPHTAMAEIASAYPHLLAGRHCFFTFALLRAAAHHRTSIRSQRCHIGGKYLGIAPAATTQIKYVSACGNGPHRQSCCCQKARYARNSSCPLCLLCQQSNVCALCSLYVRAYVRTRCARCANNANYTRSDNYVYSLRSLCQLRQMCLLCS